MRTVSAFWHGGSIVAVQTNGERNRIYDIISDRLMGDWTGKEITAAGKCGGSVVCAATGGELYIVTSEGVRTVKLNAQPLWFNAVGELTPDLCVLAGSSGKIALLDMQRAQATVTSLRELGVPKPGRDILGITESQSGTCYFMGTKELLVRYTGADCQLCVAARNETFLHSGVVWNGGLWVSCRTGTHCQLAELAQDTLLYHDIPIAGPRAACIASAQGGLLVASNEIYYGTSDDWREVGKFGEASIIRLLVEGRTIWAIGYTGKVESFPVPWFSEP